MNLHEYQGKQLFAEYGLPVSQGIAAETVQEAIAAADLIGGDRWVVKAQVHAGGRGKAGGVKLVSSKSDIEDFARHWLGNNLVTYQTDANGQPVSEPYQSSNPNVVYKPQMQTVTPEPVEFDNDVIRNDILSILENRSESAYTEFSRVNELEAKLRD